MAKFTFSDLKGKTLSSSPVILAGLALAALIPLVVLYVELFQMSIYSTWTIPTGPDVQGILVHVFGYYGVGAYSLIAVVAAAATFRPFKFDLTLFGVRFLGIMVQVFFMLDFIMLVLSPYIWASFFLIIPLVASYFVMQGSKLRVRVGYRKDGVFKPFPPKETRIQIPASSQVQIHVAGVGIKNISVGVEEATGRFDEKVLQHSMGEEAWEIGDVPIQNYPANLTVMYKKDKIRSLQVDKEQGIPVTSLLVDITVLFQPKLADGELTMRMMDDVPLIEVVKLAVRKWKTYFVGEVNFDNIKVYQESKELSMARSLAENGIVEGSKIEIAQLK